MPETPLAGIKVVEFTHMVMGPAAGVILGDLGAEVVKIEPMGGDHTRNLLGAGAGYFLMFNRNKRSLCLDLKQPEGVALARRLIDAADILIENFRPGALAKLGLDYETLSQSNPGLIYCAAKGFLPGPYEERTALDEVTQMMGGLAYMTGPPGRPLRAGASVIDIAGGMFGVVGILAALERRRRTGKGGEVKTALYETTAFLVGQHMAQMAMTGVAAKPMPVRTSAWAIYDVFETANEGEQLFVGVVTDTQWTKFCAAFDLPDLASSAYAKNNDRVKARDVLLPRIRALFASMKRADLMRELERVGLPFAPIARPEDLFDDPHLVQSEGLLETRVPGGGVTHLPALPISIDGARMARRTDVPVAPGQDAEIVLGELGLSGQEISDLRARQIVG